MPPPPPLSLGSRRTRTPHYRLTPRYPRESQIRRRDAHIISNYSCVSSALRQLVRMEENPIRADDDDDVPHREHFCWREGEQLEE